jgi:hypothetical protein
MFFFEKKNQKTFAPALSPRHVKKVTRHGTQQIKVFCFFFSKRSAFFLRVLPIRPPVTETSTNGRSARQRRSALILVPRNSG